MGSDTSVLESLKGLDALVESARSLSADAVLIAGDLFDAQNIPHDVVRRTFAALAEIGRPVVVVPGNHDTLLVSPVFRETPLPANVRVLLTAEGESAKLDSLDLTVWGRPVYDHSPAFRPLQGMRPRPDGGWYVALAHGLVTGSAGMVGRSSPILPAELAQAQCDYIALGHVHQFRQASRGGPPAFYCGAPSGVSEPTMAVVRLHPQEGVSVAPVKL